VSRATSKAEIHSIRARTAKLRADSLRQWGTMTPNEMLCHLADALRGPLGDKAMGAARPRLQQLLTKFVLLSVLSRYPKGQKARAEVDPKALGTKPEEFARDMKALDDLTARFVAAAPSLTVKHPRFGPMTENDWLRWWYMHTDHHLRQFGV
jgi:hypothetical protein